MAEQKAVIKDTDMPADMQQQAVQCAARSLEEHSPECSVAAHIKREFDRRYSPTWHCVVGRSFASCVTHETNNFIFAYLGHVALLLFKTA
ncbi:dynein light chain LC6, flagellar outer arm-like [Excalfactoria chinensis]|uniref:dynein light chain LC6, flagellar outer arm-like n=1 Tax=Excalfactoria chinensis TaxID=46218 RepID=UPI003B3A4013